MTENWIEDWKDVYVREDQYNDLHKKGQTTVGDEIWRVKEINGYKTKNVNKLVYSYDHHYNLLRHVCEFKHLKKKNGYKIKVKRIAKKNGGFYYKIVATCQDRFNNENEAKEVAKWLSVTLNVDFKTWGKVDE